VIDWKAAETADGREHAGSVLELNVELRGAVGQAEYSTLEERLQLYHCSPEITSTPISLIRMPSLEVFPAS
jgi:hypothetical protein